MILYDRDFRHEKVNQISNSLKKDKDIDFDKDYQISFQQKKKKEKKEKKDDENNNISNTSFISINRDHVESSSSVIEYSRKLQKSGRIG